MKPKQLIAKGVRIILKNLKSKSKSLDDDLRSLEQERVINTTPMRVDTLGESLAKAEEKRLGKPKTPGSNGR